jgi:serine/arginine repetitive matrix protein 2
MAEDDDNFLDGVIEFGDGRQYKIESTDVHSDPPQLSDSFSSPPQVTSKPKSRLDDVVPLKDPASFIPVSKEERFADDFDRSWPRSRTSPALSTRDFPPASAAPPPPVSPVMSQVMHSPQEASRVLFNERSNRLEPYSNTHRPGPGQHPTKRGGHPEFSVSPTEPRSARDFPLPSPSQNPIQLLQKPGNADFPPRSRRFSGGSPASGPSNVHTRDRDQAPRRDAPPPSPHLSRDNHNTGMGKDQGFNVERGRRSAMGPPPLPLHSLRGPSRDGGRQLPPHLSQIPPSAPAPQGRLSSRDSRFSPHSASGEFATPPHSARLPSQSPALSHASAAQISPALAVSALPQLSAPELDVVRKDVMQNAAARAKQRRQQEEEEREKDKERARRKAAELEERMKAAEAEKIKIREAREEAEKQAKAQVRGILLFKIYPGSLLAG